MPPGRPRQRSHQAVLRALAAVNPKTRKALLEGADKDLVYSLCELALNFLSGQIPVSPSNKQKLSKYKTQIRSLAQKGGSWRQKKKIVQRGGGAFIPILLSLLGPSIAKLIFGS